MPAERHPTDPLVDELLGLFTRSQARLEAIVHDGLRRGLSAERINTPGQIRGDATHAYRVRQHQQAGAILEQLRRHVASAGPLVTGRAYRAGAFAANRTLHASLTGVPQAGVAAVTFGGVHVRAAEAIAQNMTGALTEAIDRIDSNIGLVFERADALEAGIPPSGLDGFPFLGRREDDPYRSAALEQVGQGLVAMDTRREVTAQLAERLIREGTTDALTGFVDRAGRRWPLETYTKMVARTTTREAVSRGTVNRLAEAGQDLVEISSHAHKADECTPYDGQTFSLEGATPGYEVLDQLPPFHPNCLHVVTPAGADLEAWEQELADQLEQPDAGDTVAKVADAKAPKAPAAKAPAARKSRKLTDRQKRVNQLERKLKRKMPTEQTAMRDHEIAQAYRVATDPKQGSRIEAALYGGPNAPALTAADQELLAAIRATPSYREAQALVRSKVQDHRAIAEALADTADPTGLADDVIRGLLNIEAPSAPIMTRHLAEYAKVPKHLRDALHRAGYKVHLGDKAVPELDDLSRLRGVHPRGYGASATWDQVAGVKSGRIIAAGDVAGGHGSYSLVAHEIGHALDDLLGVVGAQPGRAPFSALDAAWDRHHRRLFDRLRSYYRQDGPGGEGGKSELFAEAVAEIIGRPSGRNGAAISYDAETIDYLVELLGRLR